MGTEDWEKLEKKALKKFESLEDWCKKADISFSTYWRWKTNVSSPTMKKLEALKNAAA